MSGHFEMWRHLRPLLNGDGWHAMRVENPALPGTPDVNWAGDGAEGWLEIKYVHRYPPKGGTVQVRDFSPQQRVWLTKRRRVGGNAKLIARIADDWILFDGLVAGLFLGREVKERLHQEALRVWGRNPGRDELREALLR